MKKLNIILLFLLLFISCSNEDAGNLVTDDVTLECSPEKVETSGAGGVYTLDVTCSDSEWTALASDDCSSWIAVKVAGSLSSKGTATVTVSANTSKDSRNGSVIIKSGAKRVVIPVTQGAPMSVSQREIYSNSRGENFTLSVVTTGDWSVTFNDSWIKVEKKDSKTVSVTTEPNESKTSRKGTLDIVSGAEKITVSVAQESAEDREINTPEGYRLVWHDEFMHLVKMMF